MDSEHQTSGKGYKDDARNGRSRDDSDEGALSGGDDASSNGGDLKRKPKANGSPATLGDEESDEGDAMEEDSGDNFEEERRRKRKHGEAMEPSTEDLDQPNRKRAKPTYSRQEDNLIIHLVCQVPFGIKPDWAAIASYLGRSKKSVRTRYESCLAPESAHRWTDVDDARVIQAHMLHTRQRKTGVGSVSTIKTALKQYDPPNLSLGMALTRVDSKTTVAIRSRLNYLKLSGEIPSLSDPKYEEILTGINDFLRSGRKYNDTSMSLMLTEPKRFAILSLMSQLIKGEEATSSATINGAASVALPVKAEPSPEKPQLANVAAPVQPDVPVPNSFAASIPVKQEVARVPLF